jgi:hypothetical protein
MTRIDWEAQNREPDGSIRPLNNEQFFFNLDENRQPYAWALRCFVDSLSTEESAALGKQWSLRVSKEPLRHDPADVLGAFVFFRDSARVDDAVARHKRSEARDALGWLGSALAVVASRADAMALRDDISPPYAFDLVEHLDASAAPILEAIIKQKKKMGATYVLASYVNAMKLVGK